MIDLPLSCRRPRLDCHLEKKRRQKWVPSNQGERGVTHMSAILLRSPFKTVGGKYVPLHDSLCKYANKRVANLGSDLPAKKGCKSGVKTAKDAQRSLLKSRWHDAQTDIGHPPLPPLVA
jgi:hypothetical protein